ncbi:hypothetical protein ABRT01_07945 [Lentibacillus sp. L22]|uniref:hypothetical protein n=1 Tax=Lentibacillus TaxID=175304 RepID=UPI0022B18A59|nr:hypothetical protein [Lentibacillus daqui]
MQTSHESRNKKLEMLLWSIALPGFGQLLNKHYIKGIFFVILEFIINVNGNFNTIIVLSFNGKTLEAVEQTNYLWLMFYPCLYFFAMWDAFRDAGGGKRSYSFMPFVFSAYFVTLGLIFSPGLRLFGILPGPMWLPILFLPLGLAVGFLIQFILLRGKIDKR